MLITKIWWLGILSQFPTYVISVFSLIVSAVFLKNVSILSGEIRSLALKLGLSSRAYH